MLVHPDWDGPPAPVMFWMHGRTASKELDPGRYLRWMRAGIGACAVDLPGHGERHDQGMQAPDRSYEMVLGMLEEIDEIVAALARIEAFDSSRLGVGGMSGGGMAALARLCRPHPFRCASVEAASGSWEVQCHRRMFHAVAPDEVHRCNPIDHLDGWREIPLQAFHSRSDEWVDFDGQSQFLESLRRRYEEPERIEFVVFDQTGAPMEHVGFGRKAAVVKNMQRDFLAAPPARCLTRPEHRCPRHAETDQIRHNSTG